MENWQIAFGVLQIIFTIALVWFIRLLLVFSGDVKNLQKEFQKIKTDHEVEKALRRQKDIDIGEKIDTLADKFNTITKITVVGKQDD